MKNVASSLLLVLLAVSAGRLAGAAQLQSDGNANTPVTRAVMLLKGLVMKAEMQQKMEEKLFDKFVCWAKTIISQKTASNAEAESRIEVLETYIANIDAGRVDFTTERVDLEKAIEGLKEDIETADSLRKEENENFEAARDEMNAAIAALDKAIAVLGKATSNHKTGVFLAQRDELKEDLTFASAQRESADLQRAVKLGKTVLSAGDAVFLQRLLTGEVPKWDWKKLNRKATFKMSYKARSFKIQEVLQNMQATFSDNLKDATEKEADAVALYKKLSDAKKKELDNTQDALEKMTGESAARGQTKQESQDEIDDLKEQMKNDNKFIKQTKDSLAEKTSQWKERSKLRMAEISAMSEAISILHNDDARDLMRRSFKSQGYSFMQQGTSSQAGRMHRAAAILKTAARSTGDSALATLATQLSKATPLTDNSPFAAVIGAINKMIAILQAEETSDLEQKESCEKHRMEDTRDAIVKAREIDEHTEAINALEAEIAEIKKSIEETIAQIAQTTQELKTATEMRNAEHAEWVTNNKDDVDALDAITRGKAVLTTFYKDNMLTPALVQVPAGEAPLPPPKTWDEVDDYSKQGEFGRKSILALLDSIIDDVNKDMNAAKAEEDKAALEYGTFKSESEAQLGNLQKAKNGLVKTKGTKEGDVADTKKERVGANSELDAVVQSIKDADSGCDYITINYPVKLKNRQIELDGLTKAKAILVGGTFDAGPDPNREVKPGDALFLQKRK